MSRIDLALLIVQALGVVAVGFWLRRRLHTGEDFMLGRRRLAMPLSAAALSLNSVPIWWLLMVSAAAYVLGLAAIWFALALLGGCAIGGWYVAPRLRALTNLQQRGSFSELLASDAGEKMRALLLRSTWAMIALLLVLGAVFQMQLAARLLATVFDTSAATTTILMAIVLCAALMLSGIWTTVIADLWQAIVWCSLGVVAVVALLLAPMDAPLLSQSTWFAGHEGLLIISFSVGIAFAAADAAGQPALLARYMACDSDMELRRARGYAFLWVVAAVALALFIGWRLRALSGAALDFTKIAELLSNTLTPKLWNAFIVVLFGALAVATGSGLQTAAAHLANDLRRGGTQASLTHCRLSLVAVAVMATTLAIYLPLASIELLFDRLLFVWHALGASFGPLLIVRLSGKRVRPGSTLGSIWSGFMLTTVFYLMPDSPGELLERGLPFTAALGIALSGGERRRNPDRADRGERTVHDRLPI